MIGGALVLGFAIWAVVKVLIFIDWLFSPGFRKALRDDKERAKTRYYEKPGWRDPRDL